MRELEKISRLKGRAERLDREVAVLSSEKRKLKKKLKNKFDISGLKGAGKRLGLINSLVKDFTARRQEVKGEIEHLLDEMEG